MQHVIHNRVLYNVLTLPFVLLTLLNETQFGDEWLFKLLGTMKVNFSCIISTFGWATPWLTTLHLYMDYTSSYLTYRQFVPCTKCCWLELPRDCSGVAVLVRDEPGAGKIWDFGHWGLCGFSLSPEIVYINVHTHTHTRKYRRHTHTNPLLIPLCLLI